MTKRAIAQEYAEFRLMRKKHKAANGYQATVDGITAYLKTLRTLWREAK